MNWRARALALAALLSAPGCSSTAPSASSADFVVAVADEQFVLRSANPETIARLRDVLAGRRQGFPAGPLLPGDGGFNRPWSWHLDPMATQVVEVAIEVCDGTPSYVEAHVADFTTYCPWAARVVSER